MPDGKRKLAILSLAGALALGLVTLTWAIRGDFSEAQEDAMHNCPQPGKWAIAVWSGEDGTDTGDALGTCGAGAVDVAYYLDPDTQQWLRWLTRRLEISNLSTLDDMQGAIALGGTQAPPTPVLGMPDPASVYCLELGYELRIDDMGGGVAICVFPDGSECEEWSFFEGRCGQSWAQEPSSSQSQDATMHNCPQPGKWAISVWSGQDGTDTAQALATCGAGAVAAAYYVDPQTQVWLRWFRDRPEIGNLSTVDDMQGVIVLGGAEAAATPTPSPTPTPPDGDVLLYSRFVPPVVYSDGSSTTTLEVHTTGQGIEAVYLESGSISFGQLHDDGSHGDQIAGDGVYTLGGITYPGPTLRFGTFSTYGFDARIVRVGGLEERQSLASLGVVLPDLSYPAVQLDAKTSATTHAIFIVDDAGEIFPGFPLSEVLCGKTNFIPYEKIYAHFPDAFDFLLVMPSGNLYDPVEFAQRENVPYFILAKNEVHNIGLPIFDDTATFGSDGRLRGAVYHSFGSPAIMEHELGHAWGIKYGSSLGLVSDTDEGGVSLSHWDEASDINGLMQEFVFADDVVGHLADNGDGTYRVVPQPPDAEAFAPLELYLMGLIPPEEVPPVHRLIDPDYSDPNRVTAEQVETITIQQLMAAEGGPRIPDHTDSPKTFTAAFIAVSDRSFSQAEYDFFSAMAQYLASTAAPKDYVAPFYAATGGRATLDTHLPPPASP